MNISQESNQTKKKKSEFALSSPYMSVFLTPM